MLAEERDLVVLSQTPALYLHPKPNMGSAFCPETPPVALYLLVCVDFQKHFAVGVVYVWGGGRGAVGLSSRCTRSHPGQEVLRDSAVQIGHLGERVPETGVLIVTPKANEVHSAPSWPHSL